MDRYSLYPPGDKTINDGRSNQTAYHSKAENEKGHSGYIGSIVQCEESGLD